MASVSWAPLHATASPQHVAAPAELETAQSTLMSLANAGEPALALAVTRETLAVSSRSSIVGWCAMTFRKMFTLRGHTREVIALAVGQARGCELLLSSAADCTLRAWSLAHRRCVWAMRGFNGRLLAMSLHGERLVAGGVDAGGQDTKLTT